MKADYDLCVIGGGINGAGIARDAQGRGLNTLLVEAQDLAGATSSNSTKLVHGGLRYLEQYDFKLVRESLNEREKLLSIAPHIIFPMDFVLPHDDTLRPKWMIRAGLFLYDHLAGRQKLKKSRSIDFAVHQYGDPLSDKYESGFTYADCWVHDSRLVVLNALDAKERGADILTRTAVTEIEPRRQVKGWRVYLTDLASGDSFTITADKIVNAAGPWVRSVLDASHLAGADTPDIRLVKGSHIVVPKLHDGDQSYLLQQPDGRIVFAIPFEYNYTVIGTTDVPFEGDASTAAISQEESDYLIEVANNAFKKQLTPKDIVWTYSGVRALVDDGAENNSKVTRDYKLVMKDGLLCVFGGKLTTYRHLAEEALDKLTGRKYRWTGGMALPGGNIKGSFDNYVDDQAMRYPFLPREIIYRYARSYGTRMDKFLEGKDSIESMGIDFGYGIFGCEVDYLIDHEFAKTAEDIFWRRSKLGLHVDSTCYHLVERYVNERINHDRSSAGH